MVHVQTIGANIPYKKNSLADNDPGAIVFYGIWNIESAMIKSMLHPVFPCLMAKVDS